VGADEDIDAVDLVEREPVDGLVPLCGCDLVRAPGAEALGRKCDAPRLGGRELLHGSPPSSRRPARRRSAIATRQEEADRNFLAGLTLV
jgi:hypothetical protein